MPLPTPTQPETLTATSVATSANRSFFIGIPSGYCLCGELNGLIATRISTLELVLKSHSTHPNRIERCSPAPVDRHFGACGFPAPQLPARMSLRCRARRQHCGLSADDWLTEFRRAAASELQFHRTSERRRSGNRHPPSFQWRADQDRPNQPGPPLRRHRSGCVVRANCARARRGEQ